VEPGHAHGLVDHTILPQPFTCGAAVHPAQIRGWNSSTLGNIINITCPSSTQTPTSSQSPSLSQQPTLSQSQTLTYSLRLHRSRPHYRRRRSQPKVNLQSPKRHRHRCSGQVQFNLRLHPRCCPLLIMRALTRNRACLSHQTLLRSGKARPVAPLALSLAQQLEYLWEVLLLFLLVVYAVLYRRPHNQAVQARCRLGFRSGRKALYGAARPPLVSWRRVVVTTAPRRTSDSTARSIANHPKSTSSVVSAISACILTCAAMRRLASRLLMVSSLE